MFKPVFEISNQTANALTAIERARGFLEAATLSHEWLEKMQDKALVLEAHHTTHIEGTQLTLKESEKLMDGKHLKNVSSDDAKELLNYRRHPFYDDAEIQTFLALRDGQPCGRLAAIVNHAHNR